MPTMTKGGRRPVLMSSAAWGQRGQGVRGEGQRERWVRAGSWLPSYLPIADTRLPRIQRYHGMARTHRLCSFPCGVAEAERRIKQVLTIMQEDLRQQGRGQERRGSALWSEQVNGLHGCMRQPQAPLQQQ